MVNQSWSPSEKNIARRAFDAAGDAMLASILAEFKTRAAAAATADDMWAVEDYLRRRRRDADEVLDYRYSQLPLVFARLISLGHMDEAQLGGLSEEKLDTIRNFLRIWGEDEEG